MKSVTSKLFTVVGLSALLAAPQAFAAKTGVTDLRAAVGHAQTSNVGRLPTAAGSYTITFDEGRVAEGDWLDNQYADWGVTFLAPAFEGNDSPNGAWATNTDMTIVTIGNGNHGGLGSPSLASGNILHSYDGWLGEDGDPSFYLAFSAPIKHFSVDFAGVALPDSTSIQVYDVNASFLGYAVASSTGQLTLTYDSATPIGYVAITAGEYNDWVGVDNISFTVAGVPEPETYALMAMGLGALALVRRRRQQ
ncbi:PEP-CTERM sorting domain-containing protein [Paucibacter sp. APW11]|uniref:PEP-CTERM sorting domain-containing protein n=1 Tax=Roseateles aquae TaxID=3077235 RepID=A0ABU3P966_9BURK|nr:PEP-CTERM sorting domain-containing protein [Paucibacter sp. APW11]MDT8999107.1 PEP-CTERM sorting domain-containing protein [Paucibacter sp. APW11]